MGTASKIAVISLALMSVVACHSGINTRVTLPTSTGRGGSTPNPGDQIFTICSPLDFSQVTWTSGLSPFRKTSVELALNISGSFEGAQGWANLTNNFDGQGLSMGLLNQNLGTGSLQPLLLEMENNFPGILQNIFSSAHLQSLEAMLAQWEADAKSSNLLGLDGIEKLSILDEPSQFGPQTAASSASVAWAVNNLYSGSNFVPQWEAELTALGESAKYISVQVEAALALHNQTLTQMAPLQVNELRAYLMVFDIMVQDGGIYAQDFSDYGTWLNQNPASNNTSRLMEILNLRLRHVKSQYVADVQSRKMAIINGSGVVHGDNRNLEQQYCFNRLLSYQN